MMSVCVPVFYRMYILLTNYPIQASNENMELISNIRNMSKLNEDVKKRINWGEQKKIY